MKQKKQLNIINAIYNKMTANLKWGETSKNSIKIRNKIREPTFFTCIPHTAGSVCLSSKRSKHKAYK